MGPPSSGGTFLALADSVLPSLVCTDDDGLGLDADHSISDGEQGDLGF